MLRGATDSLERRDTMQRDLDRLEEWTHVNLMKFKKVKCTALHPGQGHSKYQYRLQDELIASSPAQNDLEIGVDENLNLRQQCAFAAQKASCVLGCVKKSTASRLREVVLFIHSTLMRPHLEYCIYHWGPQYKKDLEEIQRKAMKMIRELKHLSHEEKQRLFGLEKTRLWADLSVVFQNMKST